MNERDLKIRTKKFSIDVLNMIDQLRIGGVRILSVINWGDPQVQRQQITGRLAGHAVMQNSSPNLELLKKKQMNPYFGWT